MSSKFTALTAVIVTLAALSGLQGVSAAEPKCKGGKELFCCNSMYQSVTQLINRCRRGFELGHAQIDTLGGYDNICTRFYYGKGNTWCGPFVLMK